MSSRLPALLLSFSLTCAAPAAFAATSNVFGAPMPEGAATPIAAALAEATPDAAQRKFAGRITEVCQAKGCWLMLEGDGQAARVMMKDHAFSVPKEARGGAVVHGTLSAQTLDAAQAQHLAEDAGRSAPVATREYRIVATSVELVGG